MRDRAAECALGLHPPVLLGNLRRQLLFHRARVPERECSRITFYDLPACTALGFVQTTGGTVPVEVASGTPIVLFSCFDILCLYLLVPGGPGTLVYGASMSACRSWSAEATVRVLLVEAADGLPPQGEDALELRCRIENLRAPGEYHYSTPPPERPVPSFRILFLGREMSMEAYRCPLCFRKFGALRPLHEHMDAFHSSVACSVEDGTLRVAAGPARERDSSDQAGVSFLRRRDGRVRPYPLRGLRLLMEEEYETLDYSEALARHANARVDGLGSEGMVAVAREWNRLRLASENPREIAGMLVERLGATQEVLELVEMLYMRGVLNSSEIMDIFR